MTEITQRSTVSPLLELDVESVERGGRSVLSDVRFALQPGELLFVVGPNGSGKSTLIDVCLDLVPAPRAKVRYSGLLFSSLPYRERPRLASLVGREENDALGFTVDEALALASAQKQDGPGRAVARSLPWLTEELRSRRLAHLSQGERQRVHLLRGFLQDASVLFWDEATAHLDLSHREEALSALRAFTASGRAALVVVHELELALRYATRLLVLHHGKMVALGTPEQCLSQGLLREVFGLNAAVAPSGASLTLSWLP